jgi:hypothetical protein
LSEIKNIFISHVHEDDPILRDLKSLLRDKGYEVRDSSIDSAKPNEAANENYIKSEILAPRIQWAGVAVVLISPDTHNSPWVEWEIEYAQKHDKRIVGVWVRGGQESDLPKNLDLYGDAVVGWQAERVIEAIDGKINNWFGSNGEERGQRNIPRYSCA